MRYNWNEGIQFFFVLLTCFGISCDTFGPINCLSTRRNRLSTFALFNSESNDITVSESSALLDESVLEEKPFAVIVKAEIQPDRMAEFLKLIETNAIETRKEPGCIRFDVVRCQEAPNQFFFYELYKNVEAIDYHKQQAHYDSWANFKSSGGTIDSVSYKADGEFWT
jgi:(4S)-4-hydroxy-5-phosphonooxypentane-2,3-dione isomerase